MFKDYYKILEISPNASDEEIKLSYRRLSKKWHPDHNQGIDVTSIMQDINEAYAILRDSIKKSRYDAEYKNFQAYYEQYTQTENEEQSSQTDTEPENNQSEDTFKSSFNKNEYYYDYDVQDDELKDDIKDAQEYASKLVKEFFKTLKTDGKKACAGAWGELKPWIIILAFFIIIGLVIGYVKSQPVQDSSISYLEEMQNKYSFKERVSDDKTYTILIPSETQPYKSVGDYLSYMQESNHLIISVYNLLDKTFKSEAEINHDNGKYNYTLIQSNDSLLLYRISANYFNAYEIYMRKEVANQEYMISVSSDKLSKEELSFLIHKIYASFKPYSSDNTTKKDKVKKELDNSWVRSNSGKGCSYLIPREFFEVKDNSGMTDIMYSNSDGSFAIGILSVESPLTLEEIKNLTSGSLDAYGYKTTIDRIEMLYGRQVYHTYSLYTINQYTTVRNSYSYKVDGKMFNVSFQYNKKGNFNAEDIISKFLKSLKFD